MPGSEQSRRSQVGSIEGVGADFVLHPLIYTLLEFSLAQDIAKKRSGARNSAFF